MSRNLQSVIARLEKWGMTVNPGKVKIHMSEVEYVGHVIDRYGISFSDDKRQSVTDFRKPTQAREMEKFLGLISLFITFLDSQI